MQYELGYDNSNKLSESFGSRVRSVGYDPKHAFYSFMMLYAFGYTMYHEQRVQFIKNYIVRVWDLQDDIKRLTKHTIHGRIREPFIIRMQRSWYIHYFIVRTTDDIVPECDADEVDLDNEEPQGYWLRVEDTMEACLYWLHLMNVHYKCVLASGHNIEQWARQFIDFQQTENRNISEDEAAAQGF